MQPTIQMIFREQGNNALGMVGVITSVTDIFPKVEQLYNMSLQMTGPNILLNIDIDSMRDLENNYQAVTFGSLLVSSMWQSFKPLFPRLSVGNIIVRRSQLFPGENAFRYIICGVFDHASNLLGDLALDIGTNGLFCEGSLMNDMSGLSETQIIELPYGLSIHQLLEHPLWGPKENRYRLNTSLCSTVFAEVINAHQKMVDGFDYEQLTISSEVRSILRIGIRNPEFMMFVKLLSQLGHPPTERLLLLSENQIKERDVRIRSAVRKLKAKEERTVWH